MNKSMLDVKALIEVSLQNAPRKKTACEIPIFDAVGRVLSEDVYCKKNLPAFNNSGMDGYAVRLADGGKWVRIVAQSFAGDSLPTHVLRDGEACKIMTGAPSPVGTESIVPFEKIVSTEDEKVLLPEKLRLNDNHKLVGEEAKIGDLLLKKGTKLTAAHLSLAASQGVSAVKVYTSVRIAVFSSGNEIKEPWEKALEHQIYNSNSTGILCMLQERGYEVSYLGALPDEKATMRERIAQALDFDVIVTTGGVSVGEADFIETVLSELGAEIFFHGVNIKPGKHTLMARLGETIFFGLPGNPLSALLNLRLFIIPVLEKMQGANAYYPAYHIAKNKKELRVKGERANMVLGSMIGGDFYPTRDNKYGSGMLLPLVESNALMVLDRGVETVEEGKEMKVLPLSDLFSEAYIDFING